MPIGWRRVSTRRDFLSEAGVGGGALLALGAAPPALAAEPDADEALWREAEAIVSRIAKPSFPKRDFVVTAFGAVGDGRVNCTAALRRAIRACTNAGGGRVVVPPGQYLTGGLRLWRNVNLHIAAGATLLFQTTPSAYLPVVRTRYGGNDLLNYAPHIYAYQQRNIAITGGGTLDGQASNAHWWPWSGLRRFGRRPGQPSLRADVDNLRAAAEAGVPIERRVFGEGHYLRPSFIEPYGCDRVLIEGITIRNAPHWAVHPLLSQNVTVRNVTVNSLGPSNDGCDPECCSAVLVEGCTFDTGDDCIAVKAGRGRNGYSGAVPYASIVIRACRMRRGFAGLAIGSEAGGGIRNVYARNLAMDGPGLRQGLFVKSTSHFGGDVQGIHCRDIAIAAVVMNPVRLSYHYLDDPPDGPYRPSFRDITVARMSCARSDEEAIHVDGFPDAQIAGIRLTDCSFTGVARIEPALRT